MTDQLILRLHLKSGNKVDMVADSVAQLESDDTHLVGVTVSGSRVMIPVVNIDWYEGL